MKYQAHRGVQQEFPENTMPSFRAAVAQGYEYLELDPCFTGDGVCVVLHDKTLNRTCRNADGTAIEKEIAIQNITYREAVQFDAGIGKAYKFRGTRIPKLSEVLNLAKESGVTVKLDNKIQNFSESQTQELFYLVKESGAQVAFTASEKEYIRKVTAYFPEAEIHYDGPVTEENLKELKGMLKNNEFYIWLRLDSSYTRFAKVPAADEELCKMVKQYGKLGLWILHKEEELKLAYQYGADLIETPGQLKPQREEGILFDCHTHTFYSHDSQCDPMDSLYTAKAKALAGFAITDHCDIEYCEGADGGKNIEASVAYAHRMKEEAVRRGEDILAGMEMGEAIWNNAEADRILSGKELDLVLGSVHAVRYKKDTIPYSRIDFSAFSEEDIRGYLEAYFEDMREMIGKTDFDILAHLTCPLRYLCGKYGRKVKTEDYRDQIEDILETIIQKGIALEVNTSCLDSGYPFLLPEPWILKCYRELGGYLVTLGSDAHIADRVGVGFEEAKKELVKLGFKQIYYYKNRIPLPLSL